MVHKDGMLVWVRVAGQSRRPPTLGPLPFGEEDGKVALAKGKIGPAEGRFTLLLQVDGTSYFLRFESAAERDDWASALISHSKEKNLKFFLDTGKTMSWTVAIEGHEERTDRVGLPFTVYSISVTLNGDSWTVHRRYNQFQRFYQSISAEFPGLNFPIPPKSWIGRMNKEFIGKRQGALEAFLKEAVANQHVAKSEELLFFLSPLYQSAREGGVEREGWLTKRGHKVKNWKKRWFVLDSRSLAYFKAEKDAEPAGVVNLVDYARVTVPTTIGDKKRAFSFVLVPRPDSGASEYEMYAETQEDMQGWMDVLRANIEALSSSAPKTPDPPVGSSSKSKS